MVRRMVFILGFCIMGLLVFLTGWDFTRTINEQNYPTLQTSNHHTLKESTIWFNALVQVILSLNIGVGVLPVLTGKYLHKGDIVKTSFVYISFNLLVSMISLTFFIMQFNNTKEYLHTQQTQLYPALKTITAIYDRALDENNELLSRIIAALAFLMILLSSLMSIIILIYSTSHIIPRHPNVTICLAALCLGIIGFICPDHLFPSILDERIVGSLIIGAMTFDIISIVWIYGIKNLYSDLKFSIGRPINKLWLVLWSIAPILLIGLLVWWAITAVVGETVIKFIPRWLPIVIELAFIVILACVEVSKQVDYNIVNMLVEATRPSKDWGPADPLIRHSWKQWKSVCEDTGEQDFTLRRRETEYYTNSIKRGQYVDFKSNISQHSPPKLSKDWGTDLNLFENNTRNPLARSETFTTTISVSSISPPLMLGQSNGLNQTSKEMYM